MSCTSSVYAHPSAYSHITDTVITSARGCVGFINILRATVSKAFTVARKINGLVNGGARARRGDTTQTPEYETVGGENKTIASHQAR